MALATQVLFVESNQRNIQEEGWWHLVVHHGRRIHALNLYASVDTVQTGILSAMAQTQMK
jgi:hypothetical protein